jgi:phage baseplate assembly protein W
MSFLGMPYPVTKHPLGMLRTQRGINQVKSDLLVLLLTEPGERVMLPEFGTPLRKLLFEPNDSSLEMIAKEIISDSIKTWEPRIAVTDIQVTNSRAELESSANPYDNGEQLDHALLVRIIFTDFDNIQQVQSLELQLPLGG